MPVTVKAEAIIGSDLQPGDLFSSYGPDYWDTALDRDSIGERVYVRTHAPASNAYDSEYVVFKITIEKVP